jgi:hypothetical protein
LQKAREQQDDIDAEDVEDDVDDNDEEVKPTSVKKAKAAAAASEYSDDEWDNEAEASQYDDTQADFYKDLVGTPPSRREILLITNTNTTTHTTTYTTTHTNTTSKSTSATIRYKNCSHTANVVG